MTVNSPSERLVAQGGLIVRRIHNGLLALTATLAFAGAGLACDNTARGAREDAAEAKEDAREGAADARTAGREAKDDAQRTANRAGNAVDAAAETVDVKTALMADATVDASSINVDTFHETKTVVLKGSVPTSAQRDEASKIAAREAEGYKIDNQLVVKPRS
jgi:hyperosmotically inducible periplasmic protein